MFTRKIEKVSELCESHTKSRGSYWGESCSDGAGMRWRVRDGLCRTEVYVKTEQLQEEKASDEVHLRLG